MATITAVTSSVQGESLNVLDPNTWVGGVVPGPNDTAVFPHRPFSYYRNTGTDTETSYQYMHPIGGPWSGSNGITMNKLARDGVTRVYNQAQFNSNTTTTLGLDEECHANGPYSSSFFCVMNPGKGIHQMINIKYQRKGTTYFASCSLNNEFSEWIPKNVYTSSLHNEFTGDKVSGYFQYNAVYFIRNYNQYHLTGSGTWAVGHIDMGNFTEFEVRDAKLELTSTTPRIDMTYGAYNSIKVLGSAHIQVSGSETTTGGGIYAYRRNYVSILVSGSTNYSSSYMTQAAEEGAKTINVADSNAFGEGDLISIHEDPNDMVFTNRVRMIDDRNNYTVAQTWDHRRFLTASIASSSYGGFIDTDQDVPEPGYTRFNHSGSIMDWEWTRVVSSSNNQLTIGKLLTKRGKVEAQLGTYTHEQFTQIFGETTTPYKGSKRAILVDLPNVERGFTSGESVTINDKAYDILHEMSYLTQSLFIDFTTGTDPRDVFIWSDNVVSGSAYSQTQLQGSYYSWDEYYRKHTLWSSGSHATIDGTIKASGSFFLDPFKLRSWGAFGTPYNTQRHESYLYAEQQIANSYWDQGEIEISASVSDDPIHNTWREYRYDESGSRWNPYSYVGILTHQSPHYRISNVASATQATKASSNDVRDYGISYGIADPYWGLFVRPAWQISYGKMLPFFGTPNSTVSGSYYSSYNTYPGSTWLNNSELLQEQYSNLSPSFNASGSGESFSLKLVRNGTENKYFYRDSGGEFQSYSDFMAYHSSRSVGVFIGRGARIYTISIKNRYRLLLLNTEDQFTKDTEVLDGGLVTSKPSGYRVEHIATEIEDPMGYHNLLKEYYEKRGKSSLRPYVQGFTYNSTSYNSGLSYLNLRYGIDVMFRNTSAGWSNYWSSPWNNAANNFTIDFGTPVTFDSIGMIFPGAGGAYGEGVRIPSLSQYGGGNYMKNIGIEYTLDNTTNFNEENIGTFRMTADDTRQSTGVTGIRFYTGSRVTAQVIRIYNAGGSRGTSYVDTSFLGAYLGQNGSDARKIKLKNTKNFKVGDEIYFHSFHKPSVESCLAAPAVNNATYQNAIYPQYVTNYNDSSYDYVTDPEHRTNGGFAFYYTIIAKNDTDRTITLDRDPVYYHLYKGTYVFKKNRGKVKFNVDHPGKQRGYCGIYWSNYGQQSRCIIRNADIDGVINLQSTTNYNGNPVFMENVTCINGTHRVPEIVSTHHHSSGLKMNIFTHKFYDYFPDSPTNQASSKVFGVLAKHNSTGGNYQHLGNGISFERNFDFRYNGRGAYSILNPFRINGGYSDKSPTKYTLHNSIYEGTYHYNNWMYQNAYDPDTNAKWMDRKNIFITSYYGNHNTSTPSSVSIPRKAYSEFYNNTMWLEKSNLLDYPTLPLYRVSPLINYGVTGDGRGQTRSFTSKNSPEYVIDGKPKNVIYNCGYNYITSDKAFVVVEVSPNHYRLMGQKSAAGESNTTVGYDVFKQCQFLANKTTEIRFKYSMQFLIDLSYMLGYGEYYINTTYYIKNRSQGRGQIPGHIDISFVVLEKDPKTAITKTIFHTYIRNNENREFKSLNIDETINIKKDCIYNIQIHHNTKNRYTYSQNILEYKNPEFALFTNDNSDIDVYRSNFDMEKQFTDDNKGHVLVQGNTISRGSQVKVQSNNLTDPIKTVKFNKIKI